MLTEKDLYKIGKLVSQEFLADVTTLTNYVDELSNAIISKALLMGNTLKFCDIKTGIKQAQTIPVLDVLPFTIQLNNLANAGFNDQGTIPNTEIKLTVCDVKVNMGVYLTGSHGLETKWFGMKMRPGSYQTQFNEFSEAFVSQLMKYVNQSADQQLWLGGYLPTQITIPNLNGGIAGSGQTGTSWTTSVHSGDTYYSTTTALNYLSACTGVLQSLLNVSNSGTTGSTTIVSSAITVNNIYSIVDLMCNSIPSNMLSVDDGISIWGDPKYIEQYKSALLNKNLFNYPVEGSLQTGDLHIQLPNRANVWLRGTYGLLGYNGLVLTNNMNIAFGTDLESDLERIVTWYSDDYEQLRFSMFWKGCGAIKFPVQTVLI
jgi:hypothetical protein